jgi:hypothetical protein
MKIYESTVGGWKKLQPTKTKNELDVLQQNAQQGLLHYGHINQFYRTIRHCRQIEDMLGYGLFKVVVFGSIHNSFIEKTTTILSRRCVLRAGGIQVERIDLDQLPHNHTWNTLAERIVVSFYFDELPNEVKDILKQAFPECTLNGKEWKEISYDYPKRSNKHLFYTFFRLKRAIKRWHQLKKGRTTELLKKYRNEFESHLFDTL